MSKLGDSFVKRVNDNPLPVDLFMDLLTVAVSAMRGQRREIPPDSERCLEDLPPGTLYMKDIPENQMAFAVLSETKSKFPKNKKKAEDTSFSFMLRWFAIQKAKLAGNLKEFTKPGEIPDTELINSAVFVVAADCPLDPQIDGTFDKAFIPRIRAQIEREREGEEN
jgi:hypothetical protein